MVTPGTFAAAPGFEFGDFYAIGLAFLGIALVAALAALSHQHERAFSASLIYLMLGLGAAGAVEGACAPWSGPASAAGGGAPAGRFCAICGPFFAGWELA